MALFTPMTYWGGGSTPPPPFNPTSIPNLAGWYDASDTTSIIKSGVAVTQFQSQGTYGDTLNSAGNGSILSGYHTLNGLNLLTFSAGNSTYLQNTSTDVLVSNFGQHFAVGLYRPESVTTIKDSLWSLDSYRDYAVSAANSSQWFGELDLGNSVGNVGVIGPSSSTNRENNWIIVTTIFTKNTSTPAIYLKVNGSNGSNYYTYYSFNLSTTQKLRIMANRNGNKKQAGRFAELLLFKNDCGPTTNSFLYSQQIEGYLAWKWGVVNLLPSNHPYKNVAP
jgi:hypothetical protein